MGNPRFIECLFRHEKTNLCLNGNWADVYGKTCEIHMCKGFREDFGCANKHLNRRVIVARNYRVYIELSLKSRQSDWSDMVDLREAARAEVPWQDDDEIRPFYDGVFFGVAFKLDEEEVCKFKGKNNFCTNHMSPYEGGTCLEDECSFIE